MTLGCKRGNDLAKSRENHLSTHTHAQTQNRAKTLSDLKNLAAALALVPF